MNYQKRHYEQFATVIRDLRASGLGSPVYLAEFTGMLIALFTRDNPRFDAERFLAACEPNRPTAKRRDHV